MIWPYNSCMDAPRIVHVALDSATVAELDVEARNQLRSRSNFAAYLIREGLRETAAADGEGMTRQ